MINEQDINSIEEQIKNERKIVDYDTKDFTVEHLVNKYLNDIENENNEIYVPEYQREFVWDEKQQSKFIESLLLGLPIPSIFLAENEDGRLEIVDGSQRIRTMASFINNELILKDLEKLTKINDLQFKDLPSSRQRKLQNVSIRVMILSENATDDVKSDLFERINRGSDNLRNMEKRKGIYPGNFTNFIYKICADNSLMLKELAPLSSTVQKRQEYEELILRFFAFSDNYESLTIVNKGIGRALDDYLQEKNKSCSEDEYLRKKEDLKKTLLFIKDVFPFGFSKEKGRPVSRTYFEAIAIGSLLALRESPNLKKNKIDVSIWLKDESFSRSVLGRSSTHSASKIKTRIDYVKETLLR